MQQTTKPKANIQKIILSPEQLELVDKLQKGVAIPYTRTKKSRTGKTYDVIMNKRPASSTERKRKISRIYGGTCRICGQIPCYKVTHDYDGAVLVEYWCEQHFDKLLS